MIICPGCGKPSRTAHPKCLQKNGLAPPAPAGAPVYVPAGARGFCGYCHRAVSLDGRGALKPHYPDGVLAETKWKKPECPGGRAEPDGAYAIANMSQRERDAILRRIGQKEKS